MTVGLCVFLLGLVAAAVTAGIVVEMHVVHRRGRRERADESRRFRDEWVVIEEDARSTLYGKDW